jgi:trimethylamine:corrinoid methyltransferase-like protein
MDQKVSKKRCYAKGTSAAGYNQQADELKNMGLLWSKLYHNVNKPVCNVSGGRKVYTGDDREDVENSTAPPHHHNNIHTVTTPPCQSTTVFPPKYHHTTTLHQHENTTTLHYYAITPRPHCTITHILLNTIPLKHNTTT